MSELQPSAVAKFLSQPAPVRLIATDMDGTLTRQSQFTADLLRGLEGLQAAGWPVVIVTGRSAGWVSGLVHYLPITGAMAENGGVYFPKAAQPVAPELLSDIPDLMVHRQQLRQVFIELQQHWPQIQESADNRFRLTDWTFEISGLTEPDLTNLSQICHRLGWGFTYSTVQCHIFKPGQCKATGLKTLLPRHFSHLSLMDVLTVGDSPNDESLFDPQIFPYSVGVANVQHYWEQLSYRPACVTHNAEVDGFLELVGTLLT
ncbi:MAG: HAD family phosphatase [Leptolyngbyaceae cyanobacterium SM2_5_2]|nr:HAD family phosphatase [Leptolyngbyaceae cyanobacterium SM2_5_2]